MKTVLRVINFLSFVGSILFTLFALISLFENSLFESKLMFADFESLLSIAGAFLLLGFVLSYIRKKINKRSYYSE